MGLFPIFQNWSNQFSMTEFLIVVTTFGKLHRIIILCLNIIAHSFSNFICPKKWVTFLKKSIVLFILLSLYHIEGSTILYVSLDLTW